MVSDDVGNPGLDRLIVARAGIGDRRAHLQPDGLRMVRLGRKNIPVNLARLPSSTDDLGLLDNLTHSLRQQFMIGGPGEQLQHRLLRL
jgi:hypothetical protein